MDSKIRTTVMGGGRGLGGNGAREAEMECGSADDKDIDVVGFPAENPSRSKIEIETEKKSKSETEIETESDSKNSGSDSSACDGAWESEMDSCSSERCAPLIHSRLRLNEYCVQTDSSIGLNRSSRTASEEIKSDCCSRNIACAPNQRVVDKFRFTIAHLLGH